MIGPYTVAFFPYCLGFNFGRFTSFWYWRCDFGWLKITKSRETK